MWGGEIAWQATMTKNLEKVCFAGRLGILTSSLLVSQLPTRRNGQLTREVDSHPIWSGT